MKQRSLSLELSLFLPSQTQSRIHVYKPPIDFCDYECHKKVDCRSANGTRNHVMQLGTPHDMNRRERIISSARCPQVVPVMVIFVLLLLVDCKTVANGESSVLMGMIESGIPNDDSPDATATFRSKSTWSPL